MQSLDPKACQSLLSKFKIKDNGLQQALASYDKLGEDDHDQRLKAIGNVSQLANTLKRSKEAAAAPQVVKYLSDLASAADTEKNGVTKLKAAAQKAEAEASKAKVAADKAKLAADKAKAAQDKEDESDPGEAEGGGTDDKLQSNYKNVLLSMLQKVKTAKDVTYQYLICDTKPNIGLMIAPKIGPKHKDMLTKVTGGGKRFLKPDAITFEDSHFCLAADKPVAGMAKKVQMSLKTLTGKKFPVMYAGAKAADEEDSTAGQGADAGAEASGAPAAPADAGAPAGGGFSISGSVGKGGKNQSADVQAVQTALNAKAKAGLAVDGKCGPKTIAAIMDFQKRLGKFKPDGLVEVGRGTARALAGTAVPGPAPEPPNPIAPPKLGTGTLAKAPIAWQSTRANVQRNFGELKKAIRGEYASEHPTLVKDIEDNLKKLDAILAKFDTSLEDTLTKANAEKNPGARKVHLQNAKVILANHMKYVKSEPLIAHIDNNPWVQTNCRKMLTDCFLHVAQALGT